MIKTVKVREEKTLIRREAYIAQDGKYSSNCVYETKTIRDITYHIDKSEINNLMDTTVSYKQILDSYDEYRSNCCW